MTLAICEIAPFSLPSAARALQMHAADLLTSLNIIAEPDASWLWRVATAFGTHYPLRDRHCINFAHQLYTCVVAPPLLLSCSCATIGLVPDSGRDCAGIVRRHHGATRRQLQQQLEGVLGRRHSVLLHTKSRPQEAVSSMPAIIVHAVQAGTAPPLHMAPVPWLWRDKSCHGCGLRCAWRTVQLPATHIDRPDPATISDCMHQIPASPRARRRSSCRRR